MNLFSTFAAPAESGSAGSSATDAKSTAAAPVALSPTDLWLSLLTPPLLVGIIGLRTLADTLQQLGLASEELFRGDRLPSLSIAEPSMAQTTSGTAPGAGPAEP
jgi:hypothetical protein